MYQFDEQDLDGMLKSQTPEEQQASLKELTDMFLADVPEMDHESLLSLYTFLSRYKEFMADPDFVNAIAKTKEAMNIPQGNAKTVAKYNEARTGRTHLFAVDPPGAQTFEFSTK